MLDIRFLGQFDLQIDGKPINLTSRPAQSLLAYLLLNLGIQHRREKLAGMLWPDIDETKARNRLRYAIWQLRKAIGDAYLLTDKISIAFNQESDYRFDIAHIDVKSPETLSTEALQQIVRQFEGELLPGFYEDWITLERERLTSSYENKLELLIHRLIEEKRWREVIDWGEHWISLGYAPEPAFRALMIAHSQLGDISNAVAAYQRCVEALHDQVGVEPTEATQKEYRSIVRGDKYDTSSEEPSGVAVHEKSDGFPTPRFPEWVENQLEDGKNIFVARERELGQLAVTLDQSLAGQGRVVFISGDAGRGKSALAHEFSERTLQRYEDVIITHGNCEAQTGLGDPLLPFRDVATLLFGDIETKWMKDGLSRENIKRLWELFPRSTQALVELGPDLVNTFVSGEAILTRAKGFISERSRWLDRLEALVTKNQVRPTPLNIQHSDIQTDLFNQFTKVLKRIAEEHPLIILLDDLQWADLASISLLFHLGRRIANDRIMIVGIYRSDEVLKRQQEMQHPLVPVLTELKNTYGENELNLAQLDEVESRHFVDSFLDTEPNKLRDNFRQAIYLRTGGHPLFTIELLRQMQTQGDLQKDDEDYWIEGPSINWDTLPARVEAVIGGRVNRLSSSLKEILTLASVEGEEFTAEAIAYIMQVDVSTIIHQLSNELDKHHLLVEARGIQRIGDQRLSIYVFRHHLFYKYIYDSLDVVERAYLHEQVGQALETLYQDQAGQIAFRLARHYEEAGISNKAIDYLLKAGDKAKRLSVNEEAIAHLSRALEILHDLPDTQDRKQRELALQIAISAPLVATKGYTAPEAEQTFKRAMELCEQIDDKSQLPTTLWGLWSFYLVRADYSTARDLAEQILTIAQINADPAQLIIANWTLGITLVHLGEFVRARELLELVIDIYDTEIHQSLTYLYGQNPAVTCRMYLAVTLWFLGFPDEAHEMCNSALQLAEEISHPYSQTFAYGIASVLYAERREVETSLHYAQQAVKHSKKEGFPFLMALGMTIRGWARSELGKTSMTVGQMRRGIDGMKMIGAELGRPIFLSLLVETYGKYGQVKEGLTVIDEAILIASKKRERLNESELYRLKGELLDLQGEKETKILECFHKAIEIAQHQKAKSMELRGIMKLYSYQQKHGLSNTTQHDLANIYGWFTEGFESVDLVDVHNILERDN